MCNANTRLDSLPSLTSRLDLRFGRFLNVGTFDLGFWAWLLLLKGGFAWKILATFDGFCGQPLSNVFCSPVVCFFVV